MKATLPTACNALGVAEALAEAWTTEPDELLLTCAPDTFIYPGGAAWLTSLLKLLKAQGTGLSFDFAPNPDAGAYLARMDFFEHLGVDGPECGEKHPAAGRFLPLLPIEDHDTAYTAVNQILDLLLMHFDDARAILPAIEWALNEITDNIIIHAESPVPGFIFAQFYPEKGMLSAAICDAGRGLAASLSEAHQVESPRHGLELAMQRGVTRGAGQGNGIAGTREILEVNGGAFTIWGDGAHYYEDATRGTRDHDIAPLAGTGIEMRFDTKRPIDLRKTFIEAAAYTYIEAIAERLSDGESVLIAHESSGFGSRVPAQRVRRKLLSILPDMEGPLTLDFAGVHSVASSYIDELLGKLIAELGVDNFEDQIRVVNMAPAVMRRANVTIGQRLKTMGQERQVVGTGIDWDNVRPEPELELEAWLAVHPEDLEKEARAVIEGFAYRWEIELDDEVYRVMLAVFERVRDEEGEDPATG